MADATPGNQAADGCPPNAPVRPRRRRRPRVSASVARATLDRLTAIADARGESLGRIIDLVTAEADGNFTRLCHAVGHELRPVREAGDAIRAATRHPEAAAAVDRIEAAVAAARATLGRRG